MLIKIIQLQLTTFRTIRLYDIYYYYFSSYFTTVGIYDYVWAVLIRKGYSINKKKNIQNGYRSNSIRLFLIIK